MKLTYNKQLKIYNYGKWEIEKVGGFFTILHWWAEKDDICFWQDTRKECIKVIDQLENGKTLKSILGKYYNLYTKSLY